LILSSSHNMPNIQFDVEGARQHYSDDQIADALAQKANFDAIGARSAGYKSIDIINRLVAPKQTSSPTPVLQDNIGKMDDNGAIDAAVVGAGRTVDRIGKGMKQLWYGITNNDKAAADLKMEADEDNKQYAKLQEQHPVTTAIGESLPSMAIPIGAPATTLATAGRMVAASAIPAALEYGSTEERTKNATGAATGAVVGGVLVPKAAGAAYQAGKNTLRSMVGDVTPEAIALAQKAEAAGIKVNAAQLGDSKFLKTLASALEQMPFTGAAQTASKQRGDFTRAVSKTFGDDVDKITPEVYARNRTRLGQSFDDLSMRNTLNLDRTTLDRLDNTLNEARQFGDDGTIRAVENLYNRVIRQSEATAKEVPSAFEGIPAHRTFVEIPGAAYSSMDKSMGEIIKAGGEKGNYVKQMQLALREAMDRSISPADKETWNQTRTQYKNLKAIRDVVSRDAADGNVPPTTLMNALNSTEAGKEAMAMGNRGGLGDLGRIGRQFVRDQVPNSGTAQRAIAMGLIGGGGYAFGAEPSQIAGMMAGGATAGRVLNKVLNNPNVVASLGKQGMTVADLVKLPPPTIARILGGITGVTIAESKNGN
jgi:hypothetical protein